MYKAGDSLLSDITFTSQPRLPIYAIHKSNVKGLKNIDELNTIYRQRFKFGIITI